MFSTGHKQSNRNKFLDSGQLVSSWRSEGSKTKVIALFVFFFSLKKKLKVEED